MRSALFLPANAMNIECVISSATLKKSHSRLQRENEISPYILGFEAGKIFSSVIF